MITEIAHQYRKQHAEHSKNSVNLSYLAMLGFFKYVLPSILVLAIIGITFFSYDSYANPQGFSNNPLTKPYPKGFGIDSTTKNTIKGVIDNGHTNDYVLLEGYFVPTDNTDDGLIFKDVAGDTIKVYMPNNQTCPMYEQMYFVWGTISKELFKTSINIVDFTPIR